MVARSDSQTTVNRTVLSRRLEPDTRHVQEGRVTLRWNGPQKVDLSYPLDSEGRAIIRLNHLATAIENAGYGLSNLPKAEATLSIWHNERVLSKQMLDVGPGLLQAALRHQLPAVAWPERWPRPLIIAVRIQGDTQRLAGIRERLHQITMRHRASVITSEEIQPLLRLELERAMSGLAEDQTVVSPGHWLAPTVLVNLQVEDTSTNSVVSLECHNINTGELLAHIAVRGSSDGLSLALDVALSKLDAALSHVFGVQQNR